MGWGFWVKDKGPKCWGSGFRIWGIGVRGSGLGNVTNSVLATESTSTSWDQVDVYKRRVVRRVIFSSTTESRWKTW